MISKFSFIGVAAVLLLSGCSTVPSDINEEPSVTSSEASSRIQEIVEESSSRAPYTGPFYRNEYGEFLGTITIRGYVYVEQKHEGDCAGDCVWDVSTEKWDACIAQCPTIPYVFFRITDGMTDALKSYLTMSEGNAFVRSDAIGLGCEERIKQFNSKSDLILSSTVDKPISITLTIPFPPFGRDAEDCHSHFTFVNAIQ